MLEVRSTAADKVDLEHEFLITPKESFLKSLEISAYSLIEITRAFLPMMKEGSAVLALTFLGAERTILNYNTMGVSKYKHILMLVLHFHIGYMR